MNTRTHFLARLSFRRQEAETGLVPSVQDFDKKLAEADAYLQILIDQLKVGDHCLFHWQCLTRAHFGETVQLERWLVKLLLH